MACPNPIIPSAISLYMMKNEMYKSLEYLEIPKGILVIFDDLNGINLQETSKEELKEGGSTSVEVIQRLLQAKVITCVKIHDYVNNMCAYYELYRH